MWRDRALGVAKLFGELNPENTRAHWMLPPEAFDAAEFGPLDYRIDIYHVGVLLLQLANSRELQFSKEEILSGRPREMALALSPPYSFALAKALRRHVAYRSASALELWRDLHSPEQAALPAVGREAVRVGAAEQADAADDRAPPAHPWR